MTEVPDEALVPDEPEEQPDAEEYEPEGDTAVSPETGTVYKVDGDAEPLETPQDAERSDDQE